MNIAGIGDIVLRSLTINRAILLLWITVFVFTHSW